MSAHMAFGDETMAAIRAEMDRPLTKDGEPVTGPMPDADAFAKLLASAPEMCGECDGAGCWPRTSWGQGERGDIDFCPTCDGRGVKG